MKRTITISLLGTLLFVLVSTISCDQNRDSSTGNPGITENNSHQLPSSIVDFTDSNRSIGSSLSQMTESSDRGILVTGTGIVPAEPDLATLNLGVEVTAKTVKSALREANISLNNTHKILDKYLIDEKDVQTHSFNIFPRYKYGGDGEQNFIGYQVVNSVRIKIRNLDKLGELIDDIVQATGNAVRVNGMMFNIEDDSKHRLKAQETAVQAALDQASKLSDLTGVKLGKIIHISQIAGATPANREGIPQLRSFAAENTSTSINTGTIDISVTIQALFSIE